MDNVSSLPYFVPELALVALALMVIIADLILGGRARIFLGIVTLVSIGSVFYLCLTPHTGVRLFYGMLAYDDLARYFKLFILACTFLTVLVSIRTSEVSDEYRGEFYALMMFATFGMLLMVSASNLLIVYLGIEIASIASYILAGFLTGQSRSSEAAFKYVIYGAIASGVMLFGVSILFGMAGTTDISALGERLAGAPTLGLVLSLVFLFAGFGYKIVSVPFHMWAPDVYEGSPLPVTAFLSVASKAAGFGLVLRFFRDGVGSPAIVEAIDWPLFIALISAVTMTVGNLAAFGQRNIKRLLAYSSIAHGGYLLMGVVALGANQGTPVAAVFYYFVTYLFMNLGAFYVVLHLSHPTRLGSERIEDYRGLISRSPLIAIMMSAFLFSLIGLPPLAGFWGKLYLFKSVIDASLSPGGINGGNYVWLVVLGLLNSAVSLYYYFSIVKAMLLDPAKDATRVRAHPVFVLLLLLLAIPTLLYGFFENVSRFQVLDSGAPPAMVATQSLDAP